MSDGVALRGDLMLPADASGHAIDRRLPVLVVETPYNKSVGLLGWDSKSFLGPDTPPGYFARRGYAELTVDIRGTGSSEGSWCMMCPREQKDDGAVVAWAHRQPWSDGEVGMMGGSYLGFSQIFAAEQRPPGLKAIFPLAPTGDAYRDVAATGGELDASFMPFLFVLTAALGAFPPGYSGSDPESAIKMALGHIAGGLKTNLPIGIQGLLGDPKMYDGPWMDARSPITRIDRVDVPTFLVGGERDVFQRGEPMIDEALAANGVPVKYVDGPWPHFPTALGTHLGDAGYGSLPQLELAWFDHYLKGRNTHTDRISPVTYYEPGSGRWVHQQRWITSDLRARTFNLSGTSMMAGRAGGLTDGTGATGRSTLVPLPVSGLCTPSTDQWTGGMVEELGGTMPCSQDGRTGQLNDRTGLVFETAPMKRTVHLQGPIDAHLFTSATTGDGLLSVALEDVAPDGSIHRITGGWQTVSMRALDRSRSRYLDGKLVQPFHPYTLASQKRLPAGRIAPVDVEVLPGVDALRPGHRLRLTIQGFDVPHLLPKVPDLLGVLGPMRIYTGADHPSSVTIPVHAD